MDQNTLAKPYNGIMDFRVYEATPGFSVVVLPDAPHYTHVAVSNDLVRITGMKKEEVIGKGHFTVFPKSPDDPDFTGELNLRASFEYIIQHKKPHEIPVQRYDIPNTDGTFQHKYWKINNAPILNEEGELLYIIHSAIDITEQIEIKRNKNVLQNIEKQHQELRFVMDFMPQMVWHTQPDGYADFFNQVYLDYTGLSLEELMGHQWTTLLHPDDIERTGKVWQEALLEGISYEVEHRLRGKDGTFNWFLTRGRALKDATGAVLKWYGSTTNIQEQKEASVQLEMRVQDRTNLLDSILKHSPAGITVYRAIRDNNEIKDFQCILANDAAETFTGINNEDRYAKSVLEITPALKESPLFKAAVQAVERGVAFRTEYYNKDINQWLELSVVKMYDSHFINVFRDITPIKESQLALEQTAARFKAVFDAAQQGMFTFNPVRNETGEIVDFHFVITNPTFAAYVKQTPEVLNGALGSTWFPGYLTNGVFEMYKKTYLTGETQRTDIHYNVDQHDIFLDLQSTKVGEEVLVTFTDYTELKRAQLQLEKHLEELKRTNQNLEEFAYAASHDLKEPVRKIMVFTDLLKSSFKTQLSDEQKRYFERIEFASKRMSTLIEDLLLYSYITKGATLENEVNLNDKVALVLQDLDLEIEQKEAKVIVNPLPVIKGHRRQLQQLFHNLIGNALKYHKPGEPPEIHIRSKNVWGKEMPVQLTAKETEKKYYLIQVQDNGIGFEQKDAERIFKVFTRLHVNKEYRGTGVGLSIVHRIVENHNGHIWAESQPREGSTFNILLPVD